MQKFLSLIIVILILYNIVKLKTSSGNENSSSSQISKITERNVDSESKENIGDDQDVILSGNLVERAVSRVIINALKTEEGKVFFENILQPLNKPINTQDYSIKVHKDLIAPLFKIKTSGHGSVGPATCGHVVTVFYQLSDMSNNLVSEGNKTFTLGSGAIVVGADAVIVGMMAGQVREAVIPSKYDYANANYRNNSSAPDSSYKLKVILKSIMPQNFVRDNEVKIFDDEIAYRVPLLCGNKVSFDAKITRLLNGKVLYDSKLHGGKIDMRIGDITYPLIFSYALHDKVPVGTRTVLALGKTFQATGSKLNKIILGESVSTDEYLMLELNNFKLD